MPAGGIGTGTIGIGGRGQLRDWELQNVPNKGSEVRETFFAVRVVGPDGKPAARIVEGALFPGEYEGGLGSPAPMAGFPRFDHCTFESAYPLTRIVLTDDDFPLRVELEAFNPLIPGDADDSGLPVIFWTLRLVNLTADHLDVSILCSAGNFIGQSHRSPGHDPTEPRTSPRSAGNIRGVILSDDGVSSADEGWGSFAVAVAGEDAVTWQGPDWELGRWNQGLWAMWDGFVRTGQPGEPPSGESHRPGMTPAATLGRSLTVDALGSADATFAFAWHFPNRRAWISSGHGPEGASGEDIVGNYYTEGLDDAWSVIERVLPRRAELEAATVHFVEAFLASDLEETVKEAALFNLSTLRSPTVFRTADGNPFGWEGVFDHAGSCLGSCTHVWNYEFATPLLFGDLARRMRTIEFAHATAESGAMSFRVMLPLSKAQEFGSAAADGQFGCVVKLYREWQLSGDDKFLARLWPDCKRAVEFAWLEGSWDADRDGVAEGANHNTMDVEYFGPNPLIQGWYVAALRAASAMAAHLGDSDFADRCRSLAQRGSAWTEEHLFNGEYYVQDIQPPADFSVIRPELRLPALGSARADVPEYQVGTGCLIDQFAGEVGAQLAGLGGVFDSSNMSAALESIHRYNYVPRFARWTNPMRSYVLGDDDGHRMVAYPDGVPEHPMPYWTEVMTGFEYTYAIALVLAGHQTAGLDVVRSIRGRYDGLRRNPFNEAECGHHYARAMASWGLVAVLTGFSYSGVDGRLAFAASDAPATWVWSTGGAWGTVTQTLKGGQRSVHLSVERGTLDIRVLTIGGSDAADLQPRIYCAGDTLGITMPA
jgi:uncharacterized protein (DUF608 family)